MVGPYGVRVLRLNKRTEYALLALRFLQRREPEERSSAKEIATWYNIPEMLLAKVLQVLKRAGVVDATKGSGGGYALARPLDQTPLYDVLSMFNEQVRLVDCLSDEHEGCAQQHQCDIKGPLEVLDSVIMEPLKRLSVAELFITDGARVRPRTLSIFR